jgi:ribonuclease HII
MALAATYDLEASETALGRGPVAGIDEAGRGPWAGPVVAAAVILDAAAIPPGIADSKALEPDVREALSRLIMASAAVGIGVADVERIDRDNILNATLWAMAEAVKALPVKPRLALVDGNRAPRLPCETRTIVSGDARCLSIAAASIIAKVTRDRLMVELGRALPAYGFERHKGYGTPEHRTALAHHGATEHHRRSFRPVQLALGLAR